MTKVPVRLAVRRPALPQQQQSDSGKTQITCHGNNGGDQGPNERGMGVEVVGGRNCCESAGKVRRSYIEIK